MLPLQKKYHIKLWSNTPKAFASSTQNNLDIKSFIQPDLQDEELVVLREANSKLNCKFVRGGALKAPDESRVRIRLPRSDPSRLNSPNGPSAKLNHSIVELRTRKSYSIVRSVKSRQSSSIINMSYVKHGDAINCKKVRLKSCEADSQFELPSEESYNVLKEFTQGVKQLINELGYSKSFGSPKSLFKGRINTADTETSDKQTPKSYYTRTKDAVEFRSAQIGGFCSSLISTRVNSLRTTERLESAKDILQTKTIDELSQESEEESRLHEFEEMNILPTSLATGSDMLQLRIAVADVAFC
eukprot:TRINITY_DN9670_c0_g1_i4.p1 TRINITY_DN9670_c0_g1~~TRINITY_DN9670_c0_g1_i4.p1  ORF type:complete len:300 (+),score=44.58 TRINITY_DN9670_c0_g1_i4:173-1072(+)